jgi:hypothetical protein
LARNIALIEPDPQDWGGWVEYLLERLEGESKRRDKKEEFGRMLKDLYLDIGN